MKQKKVYLEVLRIIAIVLVVTNHTDINYYYYHDTGNPITFFVSLFVTILCEADVPLFFMISGALLLGKSDTVRDTYRKRVLRMVLVLLIFSALQYLVKMIRGNIQPASAGDFFSKLFSGEIQETYWFLYAYLGFMMVLPFMQKLAQNLDSAEYRYLMILKIAADVIIPLIYALTVIDLDDSWQGSIQFVTADVWYFLVGYYLANRIDDNCYRKKAAIRKIVLAFMAGILLPMCLVVIDYYTSGELKDDYLMMTTPVLAVTIFMAVKYLVSIATCTQRWNKEVLFLGQLVFAVYLTEWFARALFLPLYKLLITKMFGVAACTIYIFCSLVLSFIFAGLLKKIPGLNKLI